MRTRKECIARPKGRDGYGSIIVDLCNWKQCRYVISHEKISS